MNILYYIQVNPSKNQLVFTFEGGFTDTEKCFSCNEIDLKRDVFRIQMATMASVLIQCVSMELKFKLGQSAISDHISDSKEIDSDAILVTTINGCIQVVGYIDMRKTLFCQCSPKQKSKSALNRS